MHLVGKKRKQLVDEINITPLTDVFLVLLIIMMVVAPIIKMTQTEIDPPTVDGGDPITTVKLVVEITRDGRLFVDGAPTAEESLEETLRAKAESADKREIIISADRNARSAVVVGALEAARRAAYENLTIAVQTLNPARGEELAAPPAEAGAS